MFMCDTLSHLYIDDNYNCLYRYIDGKKTVPRGYLRANLPQTKRDKKLINYIFKIHVNTRGYTKIHGYLIPVWRIPARV